MTKILNARSRNLQGRITAELMPQEMREGLRPEFHSDDLRISIVATWMEDGQITFGLYIIHDAEGGTDQIYGSEERFSPGALLQVMPAVQLAHFTDGDGHSIDCDELVEDAILEWVALNVKDTVQFERAGNHDDIVIGFAVAGRVVEVRIPPHDHHHWFNPLGAFDPDQED